MELQDIEKKYGFEYPELYKQLYLDGMLDMGEYGPNWYSEIYPTLKDNPPLLLNSCDFELLTLKSVCEEIDELSDPNNYRKINKEFKFVPFAKSGGGDHYCFFMSNKDNSDIPIVFVWHDLNEVEYLAKNLQDFIFKMLLNDMSYFDDEDLSDSEIENNINNVFKSHAKYLTDKEQDILQNILIREIIDYEISFSYGNEDVRGLLTDIEMKKIINEIIPFDKMDTSFEYSTE